MSPPIEALIILAAFAGNTVAVIVGAVLTARYGARAARAAANAQLATETARLDAATAQKQALEAARRLVQAARATDTKLAAVVVAAKSTGAAIAEISKTGKATHTIVNNDRSVMLASLAVLTRRIARDNPEDEDAQVAAAQAQVQAEAARVINLDPETKA